MSRIEEPLKETLVRWGLPQDKISETMTKIRREKARFLASDARVFCSTCLTTFYEGKASEIMKVCPIISDYRMLAFRHAWDNPEHKVIVQIVFEGFELMNYSAIVDELRKRLTDIHAPEAYRKSDQNWNPKIDKVTCSACGKIFNNLSNACHCCVNLKPFLPFGELEK